MTVNGQLGPGKEAHPRQPGCGSPELRPQPEGDKTPPSRMGSGDTLGTSGLLCCPRPQPATGNKPEGGHMFRNKIYSNLKQNSFQEKGMKSQFPPALSGLRGQGPNADALHGHEWLQQPRKAGTELTTRPSARTEDTCISNDKRFKNSIFI